MVVALIAERNPNAWRLKQEMELIAIGCSVSIQERLCIFLEVLLLSLITNCGNILQ